MAKRLVQAKYKIRVAHIPYRTPTMRPVRLRAVLSVLIDNADADDPLRGELRSEAIRLVRVLAA
jgi:RNA polymerase sigma-70 factor (ECF subfamily)